MSGHVIPEAALTAHIAIVGKTGSGKTYSAKGIVEQLLRAGRRVCVIDPTGAWWGLRSSADGKHPGFPVAVFGGEHADVPIAAGSGAALAGLVAGRNMPAVIDVSELLIGERHRFMEDFAAALYRENRAPLHLVIDEADDFAPQNPLPESKRMLHRVDQIVRRGRIRGFRVMLITQRPAVLHKNVLTQANTLIAMRLVSPQDRKAIEDWIKGQADLAAGREVLNSLAKLQRGQGWVWSPEHEVLECVTFPRITTFDSSRTPEDGEQIAAPTRLADIDLDAIRGSLADAQREAEENDPKVLKARIAELERAAPAQRAGASPAELAAEYARGREDGFDAALAGLSPFIERAATLQAAIDEQLGGFIDDLKRRARGGMSPAGEYPKNDEDHARQAPRTAPPPAEYAHNRINHAPAPRARGNGTGSPEVGTGGLRRMLIALAQRPSGMSARALGVRAGLSSSSGTFATYLGKARAEGWIEGGRDGMRITADGIKALGAYQPLPTGSELLAYWLDALGNSGASRLLRELARAYPRALTKEQAAERAELSASSGTFATYCGKLRTLELISGRGELKASEELFD